ncbi:MAG TPA: hypothetical protein VLI05_03500 [Candidatus Saccharimonadia bacterium]|nr:hypothetical protein [Candidatus Saccharimonadia bacterium]
MDGLWKELSVRIVNASLTPGRRGVVLETSELVQLMLSWAIEADMVGANRLPERQEVSPTIEAKWPTIEQALDARKLYQGSFSNDQWTVNVRINLRHRQGRAYWVVCAETGGWDLATKFVELTQSSLHPMRAEPTVDILVTIEPTVPQPEVELRLGELDDIQSRMPGLQIYDPHTLGELKCWSESSGPLPIGQINDNAATCYVGLRSINQAPLTGLTGQTWRPTPDGLGLLILPPPTRSFPILGIEIGLESIKYNLGVQDYDYLRRVGMQFAAALLPR